MKSPTAFRTISEVAEGLALPQHVLRFWESKFQQIKPLKRGGGRRYYRPEDVKIIHDIKELLYNQGFTIRGVQKLLRETPASSLARSMVAQPQLPVSVQPTAQSTQSPAPQPMTTQQQPQGLSSDKRREVEGVLAELRSIRKVLQQSGI
ncbi:MAG: MerR family transcriptional regulator [Alphaproteobacteria bacterium]